MYISYDLILIVIYYYMYNLIDDIHIVYYIMYIVSQIIPIVIYDNQT